MHLKKQNWSCDMYELYLGLWYASQDDLFLFHPVPP